jgi:uncharacterized protein (DUF58 family)
MKKHIIKAKKIWKLVALILLIGVTFSYGMFQGGFVSWFLFYSFLPFALYALSLAFYPLEKLSVRRSIAKSEFHAGESVIVEVTLSRKTRIPLFYMIVEDCLPSAVQTSDKGKGSKKFLFPCFGKNFSITYLLEDLQRGEHIFQSFHIRIGDPLGLIERETHVVCENKILVYPTFEELIYRPIQNQFDQGMAVTKERVQRDTTMATGVRDYQPGDRFSWINWKVSAKRNDIMVKEFEQRQSHDVQITIDCAPEERFEIIVSFAASLMRAILRRGAQVGMLAASKERLSVPIRGGDVQLQQLFYYLAKIKDDSPVPFDQVLESERFQTNDQVTNMLLTSKLSKALIEKASFKAKRKGSMLIFLLKKEMELPAENEQILTSMANRRGIKVVMIHERNFSPALSEVSRA